MDKRKRRRKRKNKGQYGFTFGQLLTDEQRNLLEGLKRK